MAWDTVLASDRLDFRRWRPDDLELAAALWSDPEVTRPIFQRSDGAHVGCCAGEAARAVIAHAFGTLGARALFAGHNPDNQASRAMLAKLGFRYTHDELYPPTGRMHPSYLLDAPAGPGSP